MSDITVRSISAILAASMCISLVSCKEQPIESLPTETTPTVTTTTETTETTTEATTTETTEPEVTGPFSKSYAYRIFMGTDNSMTIDMNINIDDYITTDGEKQVFELYRLASDLGWLEKGVYTYDDYIAAMEKDPNQTKIGHSNWFEYRYDDHRAVFTISEYIEDIKEYKARQVSWISFEYLKSDFAMPYFDDSSKNPAHKNVKLCFKKHYDKLEYYVSGQRSVCSRDDAIITAYGLWIITNSPDDSSQLNDLFGKFKDGNKGIQIP